MPHPFFLRVLCAILLSLFSSESLAESYKNHRGALQPSRASTSRPQVARACPGFDSNDPFSLNNRYTKGPRAGQCMNLFDYRPLHLLTEEEAHSYAAKAELPPPVPGEVWVANVWHRGKFWVVRIPDQAVEEVLFQKERFDPGIPILDRINQKRWFAAHAQVRFKFKAGKEATYIPQKTNDFSSPLQLSNLVISSEAVRPRGESFGPLKGNRDYYGLARRGLSLEEVIDVSVKKLKHQIAQYPIQTHGTTLQRDQQKQEYLLSALRRSSRDFDSYRAGKPVYYNTNTKNCLSDAIDIFDEVADYRRVSKSQERSVERRPKDVLPSLKARGLIGSQSYPTLNREFGYPNY